MRGLFLANKRRVEKVLPGIQDERERFLQSTWLIRGEVRGFHMAIRRRGKRVLFGL